MKPEKSRAMTDAEIRRLETLEKRYRNAARQQFESLSLIHI